MRPTLHLTAAVTRHAGQFLARCLDVDDLAAHGASVQEAIQALTKLAARELGDLQPPYPPPALVITLDIDRSAWQRNIAHLTPAATASATVLAFGLQPYPGVLNDLPQG